MHFLPLNSESLVATQSNGLVIRESTFSTVSTYEIEINRRSPTKATKREMQQACGEKTRPVNTKLRTSLLSDVSLNCTKFRFPSIFLPFVREIEDRELQSGYCN